MCLTGRPPRVAAKSIADVAFHLHRSYAVLDCTDLTTLGVLVVLLTTVVCPEEMVPAVVEDFGKMLPETLELLVWVALGGGEAIVEKLLDIAGALEGAGTTTVYV